MAANKSTPLGQKTDKIWRDALMRAVNRRQGKTNPKALEILADKVVAQGMDGNMQAITEIGNRLDGRPHQEVAVKSDTTLTIVEESVSETAQWLREITGSGKAQEGKKPSIN